MMATSRAANSTTDGDSVSDGSLTSAHLQEREPSDSTLSSRAESLVDSQVSRASSLFSNGLQTVGLKVGQTSKPTGNEDRAPSGMRKKWQQHYAHGKWIQLGKLLCQTACVLFFVMCVLWSQLCYPLALNSKTLFEAIIDSNDQAMSASTYNNWLLGLFSDEEDLTGGYALHSIYMWHITNPSEILEQGFKPKLAEIGPFGYIKRTTKYNIRFSADDGDKVTYRSWAMYDPVTVVNPPFLKLLHKYEPSGIISTISQEVFASIKEGMTVGFVQASKAYILTTVLEDVYHFRKAFLTIHSVLSSVYLAISAVNGTDTAVSILRGRYEDASIDCQGFRLSAYSSGCTWSVISFIESAASSLGVQGNFSEAEVQIPLACVLNLHRVKITSALFDHMFTDFRWGADQRPMSSIPKPWKAEFLLGLRSQTDGSIFDSTGGTLKWIAAGRYSGYLSRPSLPHPREVDPTGESAFNDLVATVCDWEL